MPNGTPRLLRCKVLRTGFAKASLHQQRLSQSMGERCMHLEKSKTSITPRLLRIPQAAEYIGGTNWFVEELCRNRRIAYLTVGKYRCIDVKELDRWIEAQQCGVSNAS